MSIRKTYLAGPMRGIPEFNFSAFFAAAAKLRFEGWFVFNPAEKDIERHGDKTYKGNATGSVEQAEKDCGFSLREALADDTAFICLEANAIAMLPGWKGSKGACAEHALAVALGLEIIYLEESMKAHETRTNGTHAPALPADAGARKAVPIFSGVIRYFPRALAAIAEVSRIGNEQHNPGKPLHWDRSKSGDELDALTRHLVDAGTTDTDGIRHSAKVAWRALANLEKEIEQTLQEGTK